MCQLLPGSEANAGGDGSVGKWLTWAGRHMSHDSLRVALLNLPCQTSHAEMRCVMQSLLQREAVKLSTLNEWSAEWPVCLPPWHDSGCERGPRTPQRLGSFTKICRSRSQRAMQHLVRSRAWAWPCRKKGHQPKCAFSLAFVCQATQINVCVVANKLVSDLFDVL